MRYRRVSVDEQADQAAQLADNIKKQRAETFGERR
jgi:hypothetical protein